MLRQIHKSHLGIVKCRQRAREVLFWPGMSLDVEQMVTNCSVCADFAKKQPTEPLKPTVPPSLPWQKIGTDLFEFQGEHYLLSVCYRSKFPEVTKMESLRSSVVVEELKRQFGVHGIPAEVVSDNGPQFSSSEFQEFPMTLQRSVCNFACSYRHSYRMHCANLTTTISHFKRSKT